MRGARWSGSAEAYADTFARLCAGVLPGLLGLLDARAGDLVLDAGAGTGNVGRSLADSGCRVVAAEPDPGMVGVLAGRGLPSMRASLPRLPLRDAAVDHTVAGFVVNHLADPRAGVRELARVTRHRLAASVWPGGPGPRARLLSETFDRAGVAIPAGERLPQALDFERSAAGLAAVFDEAGLREIEAREVSWTWRVTPARLWSGVTAGIGVHGRVYGAQPSDVRDSLADSFARSSEALASGGELRLAETAVVAVGVAG